MVTNIQPYWSLTMIEQKKMYSKILHMHRNIRVYIPNNTKGPYAVLYMHDGQNLFEKKYTYIGESWEVHKQVHRMIKAKLIPNLIVVGIDNNINRLDEYSPFDNDVLHDRFGSNKRRAPYGDKYASFIVEELKPFIDENYPTLRHPENTFIAGSSMGGVISLYMGLKYKHVFGGAGIFSAATWYNQDAVNKFLNTHAASDNQKYFIAVGSNEYNEPDAPLNLEYVKGSQVIHQAISRHTPNTFFKVYEGAIHTEPFWASLVVPFILHMFGR